MEPIPKIEDVRLEFERVSVSDFSFQVFRGTRGRRRNRMIATA